MLHRHLAITAATLLIGRAGSYFGGDVPKQGVQAARSYQGLSASLTLAKRSCRAGEPVDAVITYRATRGTHRLANADFKPLLIPPGRITVRDSRGRVANTLLIVRRGSLRGLHDTDRVDLTAGKKHRKALTLRPGLSYGGGSLKPGDYTLQLELQQRLVEVAGDDPGKTIVVAAPVHLRLTK